MKQERESNNPFRLLKKRYFCPFFFTQFLGAFNDNVFKNALVILITYRATEWTDINPAFLVTLCAGLFILPFFPFSATAGEIAEKIEKSKLIKIIKFLEIIIALVVVLGFVFHSLYLLISALTLLGIHSAFFGPVKYSILPQHLREDELIAGNGMVEMGTFVAILLGTVLGGLLISNRQYGEIYISIAVVVIALLGFAFSFFIPKAPAPEPKLRISWNIVQATLDSLKLLRINKHVYCALIGLSWFWFYGALFLSQFSLFCKYLGGDEYVVTFFLTMFSVGAGIGALLCEKLSYGKIELALVTMGGIGLILFPLDVYLAAPSEAARSLVSFNQFFTNFSNYRVSFDLMMMGVCAGFFTVPLAAVLQSFTPANFRSRIFGTNNILNALFMVGSSIMAILMNKLGFSITKIFLVTPILTLFVLIYIHYALKDMSDSFIKYLKI